MTKTPLAQLVNKLTVGVGAQRLPETIKKVNITHYRNSYNLGARYFLRDNLPRVQYANPSIAFAITRAEKPTPSMLTIEKADGTTSTMRLRHIRSDNVCREFLQLAGAPSA